MPYNAMKNRAFVPEEKFMREALSLAEEAFSAGEVPVGAVVVKDGKVIGRGRNRREEHQSVLGHAELEAMEQAAKVLGVALHLDSKQQTQRATIGFGLRPPFSARFPRRLERLVCNIGRTEGRAAKHAIMHRVANIAKLGRHCEIGMAVNPERNGRWIIRFNQHRFPAGILYTSLPPPGRATYHIADC